MKKAAALIFIALLAQLVAHAQTPSSRVRAAATPRRAAVDADAERILEKFIAEQGDPAAIRAVRSYVMRGRVTVQDLGLSGTIESYGKRPNKKLTVVNLPGRFGQLLEGYDGRGGWAQRPFTAAFDLRKEDADTIKQDGDGELKIRDMFSKLSLKGKATVGGHETYVVEATPVMGRPEVLYFDTQNGLLRRLDIAHRGEDDRMFPRSILYDGFAKVEGVTLPTIMQQSFADFTMTIRLYEVKFNVHIEDSLFERPKAATPDTKDDSEK